MTIMKDYMRRHMGTTCIKIRTLDKSEGFIHFGYSEKHPEDIFYFIIHGDKLDGPFYFAFARDYIERLIHRPLKSIYLPDKRYSEQGECIWNKKKDLTPI